MTPAPAPDSPGRRTRTPALAAAAGLALGLALTALPGCDVLKDRTYSASEAEEKFVRFCNKDGLVERSRLEQIKSIRGTILDPNNKNGIWQQASDTEVALKDNNEINEENIKKIADKEAGQFLPLFKKAKEGKLDISTRRVGKTEWIYLALDEPIFFLKSNKAGENPRNTAMPFSLLSLEATFEREAFRFEYDIVKDVMPPEGGTYGYGYNEKYTYKRQLIYQGIQEIFFNLAEDEKTKETAPVFFVIVIADIKNGVASKNTFYLPDFQLLMTGGIPFEEYYLRELSDVFGDENLIGDRTGRNLDVKEVTWADFLTTQMKNRIRFKFSHSDFKPQSDPDNEIVTIVANTLRYYPFRDFVAVDLYNRREKREMRFTKAQLKTYEDASAEGKSKGKVTVIRFPFLESAPGGGSSDTLSDDSTLPEVK